MPPSLALSSTLSASHPPSKVPRRAPQGLAHVDIQQWTTKDSEKRKILKQKVRVNIIRENRSLTGTAAAVFMYDNIYSSGLMAHTAHVPYKPLVHLPPPPAIIMIPLPTPSTRLSLPLHFHQYCDNHHRHCTSSYLLSKPPPPPPPHPHRHFTSTSISTSTPPT